MKSSLLWQLISKTPVNAWHYVLKKAQLYWKLFLAPATPWHVKALMIGAAVYLLLPIDFIPDTIPILGLMDDVAILSLILSYAERFIPEEMRVSQGENTDGN